MNNKKFVFALFLPLLIEQASMVCLTALHAITVSNLDTSFLSAVSLVDQINIFVSSVFICISTGTAILTAQEYGAGRNQSVGTLWKTSMFFGCAASILLTLLFLLFHKQILTLIYPGMEASIFSYSSIYLKYIALSFPFYFIFTNTSGIMRACLDAKAPMILAFLFGSINFGTTYLFVFHFNLGMLGIGLGLLCARVISAGISVLFRCNQNKGLYAAAKVNFNCLGKILKLGVFIGMETILFQFGKLLLQRFITASGKVQVDANAVVSSIMTLLILPGTAMVIIVQNLCGRYVGLGKRDQAIKLMWKSVLYNSIAFLAVSLLVLPFINPVIGLYTKDADCAAVSYRLMLLLVISLPISWSIGNLIPGGLRGMGNVQLPSAVISISMWVYRVPLSYYLCVQRGFGAFGVWLVMCVEWALYGIVFILYFAFWNKNKLSKPLHPAAMKQ